MDQFFLSHGVENFVELRNCAHLFAGILVSISHKVVIVRIRANYLG